MAVITGVLAVGCALTGVAFLDRPAPSGAVASSSSPANVQHVYLRDCAYCHGADARGTRYAPDLHGVGAAETDFQLSTGRMPVPLGDASHNQKISSPQGSQTRRTPKYDAATRAALVQYVTRLAGGGGPAIPKVDLAAGNLADGGELYRLNCAACHAWSGDGGALVDREAPAVHEATPLQVAEAVRAGPGNMPAFGTAAMTDTQLQSLGRYVQYLDHPDDRGGAPLWHLGPFAEGAVAIFLGLALLVVAVRWIGTRT